MPYVPIVVKNYYPLRIITHSPFLWFFQGEWNNWYFGWGAAMTFNSGYSGFNALLSGARHINKGWDFQGFATFFWSSTLRIDSKTWAYGMNDVDPSVSAYPASSANAFSVRCVRD